MHGSCCLCINNQGSSQYPLPKAFGKFCELAAKSKLLITAQPVFEQAGDDFAYPDTDAAEEH